MSNTSKIFLLVSAILVTTSGCKKWLSVNPSDQVSATNLFENADGYHNALNGIYQMLSESNLYGCELTWGMNSALSQDYESFYCGSHDEFLRYAFTDINTAAPIISNVWKDAFHTIANCNKLVESASAQDSSFFPLKSAEKQMIMGEAKAVRALLHFEMLRLFAPAVTSSQQDKTLPYVDTYPNYVPAYLSTAEVITKITTDLKSAQELVARMDTIINRPVLAAKKGVTAVPVGGIHFNFRRNRLNYVAIHTLLARVYLYAGDYTNAKKEAEYVYKQFSTEGRLPWWEFNPEMDFTTPGMKDNIMSSDLITSFFDRDLDLHVKGKKGLEFFNYALSSWDVASWYPDSERDFRKHLIRTDFTCEKWLPKNSSSPSTLIPVLRMSEVYYIYSECLFREGSKTKALEVLNQIRFARGKVNDFNSTDENDFFNELLAEYRREYITEGQIFFAHKRLNRDIITASKQVVMDKKIILPLPEGEKLF